jgi:hypothetical protein
VIRISSRWTFFNKRVWPLVWFALLAAFFLGGLSGVRSGRARLFPLFIAGALGVFGYFMMRKLVLDLMDEVWDAGDALLIRNNTEEERIALADIVNISYTTYQNPNRVTLTLRQPCRFGREIAFTPPARFVPFARSPVIEDLIGRVDRARQLRR